MLMDRHLGRDRVAVTVPRPRRRGSFARRALMAYMTGAPIAALLHRADRRRPVPARPGTPIRVARERPRDEAIRSAAQEIADQSTARVRAHPEYWYHFYRYWDAQRDSYEGLH